MLRLRAFGGLSLERAGVPYEGPATQRRRLALLALLASAGPLGMSRDKLVGYLWPDAEPERARHSLDDALSALRRGLQAESLFAGVATLRLNPEVITSDVGDFRDALAAGDHARAAALYAGPFLDGFYLADAGEFERWAEGERGRLAGEWSRAVAAQAEEATTRGEHEAAASAWRRLVDADPLEGRSTSALVSALAAAGQRAEALRVARVHESLLREELGAEPDPALARLVEGLRASPPVEPAPPAPAATAPLPVRAPKPSSPVRLFDESAIATPVKRHRSTRWRAATASGVAAILLLALLAAALGVRARPRGGESHVAAAPATDRRRVAVLPFENGTGDPRYAALGALAADVVTRELAGSGVVEVVSAPSPLVARAAWDETPADAGWSLGAATVVSGSVYRLGDSLRVEARLVDVARREVAAVLTPVTTPASDPGRGLEALGDRVLASLAARLDARIASFARVTTPPPSYAAYREFMAGRAAWPDYPRALEHFHRAVAIDSSYDLALIEVATAERLLGRCAVTDSIGRRVLGRGTTVAPFARAFLEGQLAMCRGDVAAAYRSSVEQWRIAPRSAAAAYDFFLASMAVNRPGEGVAALERFPLSAGAAEIGPTYFSNFAYGLHALGRHDRERAVADSGRRRYPDNAVVNRAWLLALTATGRPGEVLATVDTLVAGGQTDAAQLASTLALTALELRAHGDTGTAAAVANRLVACTTSPPPSQRATTAARPHGDIAADSSAAAATPLCASLYYPRGMTVSYAIAGRWGEAAAAARTALRSDSASVILHGLLGIAAAHLGDRATAESEAASLGVSRDPFAHRRFYWRGRILALLGRRDEAVAAFRESFAREGAITPALPAVGHMREDLDSLRGYAPFEELVRIKG